MSGVPDRATFENLYARIAPWDIGRPQAPFVAVADQVTGPALDAGCGTGDMALFFAGRGLSITGIDFLDEPIRRARKKAAKQNLSAEFLVKDALTLVEWDRRFATVLDSGLFHIFSDEDRRHYVNGLAHVIEPGGRLFLMCFSDEEPGSNGPRRVSRQDLRDAFADGWTIESLQPVRVEISPDFTDANFSDGGPRSWFVVVRKA